MTGNLKMLGLALLAAFAFGAIVAQGALAVEEEHEFETTGGETTVLTAQQEEGANHDTFVVGEFTFTCHIIARKGTMAGKSADHISLALTYDECHTNAFPQTGSTSPDTTNCTFTYDSDTNEEGHAAASLVCPKEEVITLTAAGCNIHVLPFEGLYGVTYTNLENHGPGEKDAVTMKTTLTGVPMTTTGGLVCLVAGLGAEHKTHEASFIGATEITAYEDLSTTAEAEEHKYTEGQQTNFRVEGTP